MAIRKNSKTTTASKAKEPKKIQNNPEATQQQISTLKSNIVQKIKSSSKNRKIIAFFLITAILAFIFFNRGLFIAATVNGQPITTAKVNQKLNSLYKERILSQMINEQIIEQEAAKKGVNITPAQINAKLSETEQSFGGKENFDALLVQQGLTKNEFANQIKLQLIVESLYQNEATPSEEEIKKFVEENKDLPESTDSAKFRETAKQTLTQQKLSEVFSQKFPELKNKADIKIF